MDFGTANNVVRAGAWTDAPVAQVVLDYEGRFLRRKRLEVQGGGAVLVDLPQTVSLEPGDGLQTDGGVIEVIAAAEPLLRISGDLVRLAWHIGNRHAPCQITQDCLFIRDDHVLSDMLARLGASVAAVEAPFQPEGGAYGHGRTHGHSHGPEDAGHAVTHDHGHSH